ncbi:alpha/beta hydrolase family protein [Paraliomyxa miuraensis]|uniref:alpha/beta hydrolase family protein n=1 Tax=Paraliomyxa miuraensis TaxID=376150 RepID=UPI00224E378E|nr:alpha/beta fold hydrolase [Paraliomyxa miuraensis]MCX4243338.1 prolyl oligopeptidase family serine peptidase [Paraliomyxa miuraensis]
MPDDPAQLARLTASIVRSPHLALPLALLACSSAPVDDLREPDGDVDPTTTFVRRGSYAAGYQVVRHQDLEIKAWYPARGDATASITYDVVLKFPGFPADPVAITGTALAGAPVAEDGPHPLVVLSHGFGLNPEWYHPLAEHLASHGFVVLAPEHREADWFTDVLAATIDRPLDVSATLDFAEEPAQSDWIETDRVAVIGHSYGGYTALATAGARLDPASLATRCEDVTDPMKAAYFCDAFVGNEGVLAASMGLPQIPAGLWPSMGDPRVDTVVTMAGDAYLFGEEGLAAVDLPVMAIGGTADTGTPWEWGAQLAYDHVSSSQRALVGLEGAEHMIATASCDDMPFTDSMPEEYRFYMCEDPAWDKADGLDVILHMTTAWLEHTLAGDEAALRALDPALYTTDEMLSVYFER